ncbi:MAG: helix-turn-helix domain-containing protein [Anaerovoracaceae bacterium]
MEAYEKFMISDALRSHKTLSAAAEYLGISRQNLNQKINKYKLFTVKPRELK